MALNTDTDKTKWYPVYTHSRAEKKAYEALIDKGIEVYLPLQRTLKQWSDRKKWVEEPLIKSYIFVKIEENAKTQVLMTKGIARFIYFSGRVTAMPSKQIEDLKLLMASSLELEVTEENMQPGEKIEIKAGPLKSLTGELITYKSKTQLLVRLDNLGCSIIVSIAASLINRF
ncbi:UpxY family transcription antiterminator [Mucilaginibacter glaciei]|uniref:UpxY family transcription antiterminator n=1 Tax=Mucilaginibacter glaciei TaxID=2772109 RepID=A0A926NIV7_9SPHI|nr:UpxY family transcription antiterminator [Mucilaginibacter glaciei]MBD1392909.1 UpxY family transcription antiterminator [Mucilaginibacter glaciei]